MTPDIWDDIASERARQRAKWGTEHAWGYGDCSSADVPRPVKLMVLVEEVGEVARAVLEENRNGTLRDELVQVAAVAIAWLESFGEPL